MSSNSDTASGYAIVDPDRVENPYDGTDVPGEFRRLTDPLGCDQLAFWEASADASQRA